MLNEQEGKDGNVLYAQEDILVLKKQRVVVQWKNDTKNNRDIL